MNTTPTPPSGSGGARVVPEALALRARPEPVTRINRRVLIGIAAVILFFLSGLVLAALKPPSLRLGEPRELFSVEHKPISDALAKLPASYAGVRPLKVADATPLPPGVPNLALTRPGPDAAEAAERGPSSRFLAQARESPVLFRLQTHGPATVPRAEAAPRPTAGVEPVGSSLGGSTTPGAAAPGASDADAPREPTRKLAFLKAEPDRAIYNPHALQRPVSPYQLMAGTVIAASLISGLNSDLPGVVLAQVTEPVYDSVTGRTLLIPQGSRLLGRYDNVVAFGQNRALVVWQRLLLPDGSSVLIDNLPATDTSGYAGLADAIDLHTFQLLKGVALATLLGVGSELALGSSDNALVKALQQATQQAGNRAGQRLVEQNLNLAPTLTVRPGWPLRVIVHKDIVLKPYVEPNNP
ncbi:MAG TPA: TrbI/VirB10 family protein [Hyphomicrobiaceae bacterium]|jgi:type IV secretion system protein VirB10|nr:TrbI/VirB10 family protein [Hyphomicrobiaceae bacterium]